MLLFKRGKQLPPVRSDAALLQKLHRWQVQPNVPARCTLPVSHSFSSKLSSCGSSSSSAATVSDVAEGESAKSSRLGARTFSQQFSPGGGCKELCCCLRRVLTPTSCSGEGAVPAHTSILPRLVWRQCRQTAGKVSGSCIPASPCSRVLI